MQLNTQVTAVDFIALTLRYVGNMALEALKDQLKFKYDFLSYNVLGYTRSANEYNLIHQIGSQEALGQHQKSPVMSQPTVPHLIVFGKETSMPL